ncbi:hypothetical protein HELRODRAFT_106874 [Helobdella robusta]|uniref:LIM zinc-binding domain-containing protein n=1 Tax=Helobdella robusta TaxID=6412 RepID=T1EE55_HELRO|nr:hypothetical protein HELRODRAFT_106874 [Helobdella robusta]ESN98607.1 hypothetical protein HELRODRAFT_106874 [Helobdella robusta]
MLGMCTKCGRSIMGSANGCTVLSQLYHTSCFTCCKCGVGLKNVPFYSADGQSFCEKCHLMSLPKCDTCLKPIADRVLTAVGKNYHPDCFCCVVCNSSLDNTPFTVDNSGQPHCIEDFQKKYSPRCDGCSGLIVPDENSGKATRVTILNMNFHVACYKCQDCKVLLTPVTLSSSATSTNNNNNNNADNSTRCFPLDDMLLCQKCHIKRINKLTNKANTDV